MGIKFGVLKFHEDLNSRVFNFAIFFTIAKNTKLSTIRQTEDSLALITNIE